MRKLIVSLGAILGFAMSSHAQVNIDSKMDLLRQNVQNASHNFTEYKANLEISVKNFNEATRAVNELRKLKIKALKDGKKAEANAKVFQKVIEKYNVFIQREEAEIARESKALAQLEKLIGAIRANTDQRRAFIANYQEEIKKSEGEIIGWTQKKEDVKGVISEIDVRERASLAERQKWEEKKNTYRKETEKWAKEKGSANRTLATFSRLRKKK